MENAANGIGSGVTGSKIARLGEKGRKVVIAISAAALMACSGGGGDDHTVVAAEPTTPTPTVPTPSPDSTTTSPAPAPAPVPTPNTAPSAVSFASSSTLIAEKLVAWQTVWQLSCTDFAPAGVQNTCTYTGGNSNFAVSTGGSITLLNIGLTEWTYPVSVIATDAGWLSKTVSVSIQVQEPCFGLTGEILQSCILSH